MGLEYNYTAEYPFLKYITKRVDDPIRTVYDSCVYFSTIFKPLGLKRGDKLLDIGSCVGRLARSFKNQGVTTIGIDLNIDALKIAAYKFPASSISACGNALSLPFAKNSFNATMSYDVLEHLNEPQLISVLSEAQRVSKNKLMFHRITTSEDPNIDSDESHQTKWTSRQWTEWFESNGWNVIGKTTKHPLFKAIHGNFVLEKK